MGLLACPMSSGPYDGHAGPTAPRDCAEARRSRDRDAVKVTAEGGSHPEIAVSAHQLTRRFGDTVALRDVTFDVARGEVVALLGHNGAGKTTLLRVINGLLHASEGGITTLGMDPELDGQQVRARTGVLTEYPALDDFLTPTENLATYGLMYGVDASELHPRVDRLLTRLGLADKRHVHCRDLSAGLRQRVALARALLHEPEMLLLDEPTSNLDPLAARTVRELVLEQSRELGATVMVSTHNLAEAAAIADRVVVLRMGRVMAVGTIQELSAHSAAGLTITLADPTQQPAAMLALSRCTGSVEGHATPGQFTVATDSLQADEILTLLIERHVRVAAAVPVAPSLEDIYVALHDDLGVPLHPDVRVPTAVGEPS